MNREAGPGRAAVWSVLVVAVMALAASCVGAVGSGGDAGVAPAPESSAAVVRITPGDGADEVDPVGGLRITAANGRLTQVRVTDAAGTAVAGSFTPDRRSWEPDSRLAMATRYQADAVAVDTRGRPAAKHAAFTTMVPLHTFIAFFTPENRSTVGPGMIVSLNFSRPVTDRASVQRAIRVTAEPYTEVAPHWFGNQRLDFRPEDYWLPGTKVTLSLRLKDVAGAPGVYGVQSKDVTFTIARSQVSTVDADRHLMTVRRNGRVVKTIAITAGSPQNTTYNGRMVITEKLPVTRMDGSTVGFGGEYDIPDVPHAMRLTTSGTFVHGNYWSASSTFGSANASHGCIGLSDVKGGGDNTPAGWFYDNSLVGDVVEVINSHDQTVAPDNGLNGWNMSWTDWRLGSAI